VLGVVLATAGYARADPQASLGATLGGSAEGFVGGAPARGLFHLGGRADVLFLRHRGSDMAIGPYVEAATAGFESFDAGGGAEWLVPVVADELPFVLSAGAFARNGEGRSWAPGVESTLFFGSRSFNFHSWYGLAVGVFAQSRWIPASPSSVDLVFGAQLDGMLLAMPFLLAYEAIAH
jgi:hypothetical protein